MSCCHPEGTAIAFQEKGTIVSHERSVGVRLLRGQDRDDVVARRGLVAAGAVPQDRLELLPEGVDQLRQLLGVEEGPGPVLLDFTEREVLSQTISRELPILTSATWRP